MVERFDRICIDVIDLDQAVQEYRQLFGVAPVRLADSAVEAAWLALPNTVIELRCSGQEKARVRGIVFATIGGPETEVPQNNPLDLSLTVGDGRRTVAFRARGAEGLCTTLSVDHLVLRTADAEACIDTFGDQLGIRLALDKTVPQWGGRMLFFRVGKLTLEVIESGDETGGKNYFWGIAYQCPDLDEMAAAMRERGVTLSEIREGRKPGTRVATIKSHCLGIPTLLIEPARAGSTT